MAKDSMPEPDVNEKPPEAPPLPDNQSYFIRKTMHVSTAMGVIPFIGGKELKDHHLVGIAKANGVELVPIPES